jgi:chemotaxis signal transduction protein
VLPVLDLRGLLATARTPLPSSARLVVLACEGGTVGVLAEAVPGVHDGDPAGVLPAPSTLTGEAALLVAGQVCDQAGPIAVLDAAAVYALSRRLDHRRHGG